LVEGRGGSFKGSLTAGKKNLIGQEKKVKRKTEEGKKEEILVKEQGVVRKVVNEQGEDHPEKEKEGLKKLEISKWIGRGERERVGSGG